LIYGFRDFEISIDAGILNKSQNLKIPKSLNLRVMNFIMRIVVSSIVAFGLSYILSGVHIDTFWTAIVLALVLAVLNAIVKPVLFVITIPITIVTLGLFYFVLNALMIILADKFIKGFAVDGFWWALLFSLLLSIVTSVLYKEKKEQKE
jgi:putative membrane protein